MIEDKFVQWGQELNIAELLNYSEGDLKTRLGNNFAVMSGYSQNNPHHCYNLLEHTVRTVAVLDYSGLSETEKTELQIAALYHDVGKPTVAFQKGSKTVYYHHAEKSKEIATTELKHQGLDSCTIKKICFFIEYHDMFISFKMSDEINQSTNPFIKEINEENVRTEIDNAIKKSVVNDGFAPHYSDFLVLLRLCHADAESQSEFVIENGNVVDSRKRKIDRIEAIQDIVKKI